MAVKNSIILGCKLNPENMPGYWPTRMSAIMAFILSEDWWFSSPQPEYTELFIVDGNLFGKSEDSKVTKFLLTEEDWMLYWYRLLDDANLTDEERALAHELEKLTVKRP